MTVEQCEKKAFSVIGKEGSTADGADFVQRLWAAANAGFREIEGLAKKDEQGSPIGIWGAMSDFSRSFQPWEDFRKGLYLAGVECKDAAEAPDGWTKWDIPGYEYICVENEGEDTFSQGIKYLADQNLKIVGAVHDYTCPRTGKSYMFFPIRRL